MFQWDTKGSSGAVVSTGQLGAVFTLPAINIETLKGHDCSMHLHTFIRKILHQ